jgi:hypothetical protein
MKDRETPVRTGTLLAWLAVLVTVFAVTHIAHFPGTVSYFHEVTGGQQILDLRPSFSVEETYGRLDRMGQAGRAAYLRLIFVVDVAFPLAAFAFLRALSRFSAHRASAPRWLRRTLTALPLAYLSLDLLENTSILSMLLEYPARLEPLASVLGYLTRAKRMMMVGSLALSLSLLLVALVRATLRERGQTTSP